MKYIRKNLRIDTLGAQQRAAGSRIGRMVYLSLLSLFLGSLGYYLVGGMFILSLDGIVLRERQAVDASYPGKVMEVFVKEGAKVDVGAPLMRLESFDMVKEIADLSVRDGELSVREGQIEGKLKAIEAVQPLAQRNAKESKVTLARFDSASGRGYVSVLSKDDALRGALQAAERLADLESDRAAAENELALVQKSRTTTTNALAKLQALYDDGNIRATTAGVIGARVPVPGQVVHFGDQLMQINGGSAYILAYLPDSYLFSLDEGMTVDVHGGAGSVSGKVEKILTVADALPDEFQNMFRPRDRSRLIRISLPDANPFAVSQKVAVTGCAFGVCWAW